MLKIGCLVLTVWAALNLVLSTAIVFDTMVRGGHTPALQSILSEPEIEALSPEVLATVDSIAVFANGLNVAFCLVSIFVIWNGLYRRRGWAFWGLLSGFSLAWLAGVGADYEVGTVAPMVNVISGGILLLGLSFAGVGFYRRDEAGV